MWAGQYAAMAKSMHAGEMVGEVWESACYDSIPLRRRIVCVIYRYHRLLAALLRMILSKQRSLRTAATPPQTQLTVHGVDDIG